MLSTLLELENRLNIILPKKQAKEYVTTELITAAKKWSAAVWTMARQLGPMPLTQEQITAGLDLGKKPVYIFGVHRSGTTLLRDMLDGHPQLTVLPAEGTWYTNQQHKLSLLPDDSQMTYLGTEWVRRLANPINKAPFWLLGRSDENQTSYVDFARCVMAWWAIVDKKPGTQWPHLAIILAYATCTNNLHAKYWVDKTPTNERYLNRIQQEMPAAKMIHIVRNPFATFASRKKMEPTVSVHSALRDLKTSFGVATMQAQLNNPQFLLLRYEDICEDPNAAVKQLTNFLDIEPTATLAQPTVAGIPVKANSSFNKNGKAGEILKNNPADQHDPLTRNEQQVISAYLGKLSAKLNYPLITVGFLKGLYLRIKHRLI